MSTLQKQKEEHIYLTSGCCESTDHVGRRGLIQLGLTHGWWNGKTVVAMDAEPNDSENHEFYPLNPLEFRLISEMGFYTGEGYVGLTGYTTLFQGKKWLTSIIEIEWFNEEKSRCGYREEDMHAPSKLGALSVANGLVNRARCRLERINGTAEKYYTHEHAARHEVTIHIPMEYGVEKLRTAEAYCAFMQGVML